MKGDPYTLRKVWRAPSDATHDAWPGMVLTEVYNERNTVTLFCVWTDEGAIFAAPASLKSELEDFERLFGDAVRNFTGFAPIEMT